ncbi:MAG: hypothetical protein AAF216_12355 [Pseudomonadota bacterium]
MEWLNETFDLATVAGGAGLLGGAAGTGIAVLFSGAILKFLARVATTAIMTGVGYLALLNWMGFEIIPPDDLQDRVNGLVERVQTGDAGADGNIFTPEFVPNQVVIQAAQVEIGPRTYGVVSPWRKDEVDLD